MKKIFGYNSIIVILGFIILVCLNLFGLFYLQQTAAVFFSDAWWSSWFPAYAGLFVFSIIGFNIGNNTHK